MVKFRDLAFLGFPGYRVGTDGSVWTKRKAGRYSGMKEEWSILRPHKHKDGYLSVKLCNHGIKKAFKVHHLVLFAFSGPKPEEMECRHFPDKDPTNNRIENLSWATPKKNQSDRIVHGTDIRGSDVPWSKLTEEKVLYIRQRYASGETQESLARELKVNRATIGYVVRRDTWTHI